MKSIPGGHSGSRRGPISTPRSRSRRPQHPGQRRRHRKLPLRRRIKWSVVTFGRRDIWENDIQDNCTPTCTQQNHKCIPLGLK
jgi:hypothetical protein